MYTVNLHELLLYYRLSPFFLLSLALRDRTYQTPRSWYTRHTGSTDYHSRLKELSSLFTRHAVEGLSQHTINGGGDGGGGDGGGDGGGEGGREYVYIW
jgi:hypothetical protein